MSKEEVIIRLLKDYEHNGQTYPAGQLLKTDELGADTLTEQGIAEIYEPTAEDQIVPAEEGNLSADDIRKVVKAILDEQAKQSIKSLPMSGSDQYVKTGGFVNFAHFAQEVYRAGPGNNRSEALNRWQQHCKASGLSEGVNADGGFLVPTEFKDKLLMNVLESAIVRPRATVIPMSSNSVKIPTVLETSRASSVYGGIVIYRPGEGAAKTASKPEFGQVQLTLHKLVGLCYVTDELLEDSPISLEPLLTRMFADAIAFTEDEDFINGTGANQALGIVNAPCFVTVPKESGQAAATIVTENIVKMWSRCYPRSQGKAVWLANPDCFPQLATLSLNVGTGGSAVGLLQVNTSGIAGAPSMSLLGRPLILTEHCQTVGTVGDILLCDWSQYLIGSKSGGGLKVDTSIHLKFDYDETAYRFVLRYDGQPWWAGALTPKHGSNTLSPFVGLATRS